MTDDAPVALNRIERVLLTMAGAVGGLSVLAIIAVLVARAAGVDDFTGGVWPAVTLLPTIGLPLAIVLLAIFMIAAAVRRTRLRAR